jgi:hypothetical protein
MSRFVAMVDTLPEVNERTVFDMIASKLPAHLRDELVTYRDVFEPMIETRLIEILREKIEAILAAG